MITLKRGGWCRNGRGLLLFLLLYSSIAFTVCVGRKGSKVLALLHFDSSVFWDNHARVSSNQIFIILKRLWFVYFWFILTVYRKCWLLYLFKLVWNTQKITWTSIKARCFLILKMFWCLNAPPYCFFLHIFEVKMSNFYWRITWEI